MNQEAPKPCLVVDDEPLAREVLEEYIKRIPTLSLVASCKNAIEALPILQKKRVDILFCDIKMPEISGLELIRFLDKRPAIILTTAFSEYAVEGFEVGVTDYLVKPIRFERFLKAVGRAIGNESATNTIVETATPAEPFLFFKSGSEFAKVEVTSIRYIEAYGNYVKIHTGKHPLIVHEKMSVIEEILKPYPFSRVHKSYIIPINGIKKMINNELKLEGGVTIPIGSFYKKELLGHLTRT
jgi:two-component system, LytTR family, response regulator